MVTNSTTTDRKLLEELKEVNKNLRRMILLFEKFEFTDAENFVEAMVDQVTRPEEKK